MTFLNDDAMNTLINTLGSAASGVLILLIGQWTARAQKRREDEAAARAAMRRDYESLLAALARFRGERTAHLKGRFSWGARANVTLRAAYESLAAFDWNAENQHLARFLALGPAVRHITDWRQRLDEQELAGILGPMDEVTRAAIPLAGSSHDKVADATNRVLELLTEDDDKAMTSAVADLRKAVLGAEAAMQQRRRFGLRRRHRALDSEKQSRPVIES